MRFQYETRRLPTIRISVSTTRYQYPGVGEGELGPQVNKFEQVYNDDHQMSVAGAGGRT